MIVDELIAFNDEIQKIVSDDRLSWECRYHLVFSDANMARRLRLLPYFDWYDPDTTYEEDARAFADALDSYIYGRQKYQGVDND